MVSVCVAAAVAWHQHGAGPHAAALRQKVDSGAQGISCDAVPRHRLNDVNQRQSVTQNVHVPHNATRSISTLSVVPAAVYTSLLGICVRTKDDDRCARGCFVYQALPAFPPCSASAALQCEILLGECCRGYEIIERMARAGVEPDDQVRTESQACLHALCSFTAGRGRRAAC